MSSAASEAAAGLTTGLAVEIAEKFPELNPDLLEEVAAAVPEAPSSPEQTAPAAAHETQEVDLDELPDLDPQLSDELQELLDEPDFDEEARLEVDDSEEEWQDPEAARRLTALEKRNKWLEDRHVEQSRKKWVAENVRAYPLLARYAKDELEAVQATSRRGFAREAAKLNERFAKALRPALEEIAAAKKQLKQEAVTEARAEVRDAWGTPTVGPAAAPVQASAELAELEAARKTGQLHRVLHVMFKSAGVNHE